MPGYCGPMARCRQRGIYYIIISLHINTIIYHRLLIWLKVEKKYRNFIFRELQRYRYSDHFIY